MEREERINFIIQVFTFLMHKTVKSSFSFPGGGIAQRVVASCLCELQELYSEELSPERLSDFVICQVYTISQFDKSYLPKWKVNHSFGKKAIERFTGSTQGRKYYEDKWLKSYGLFRAGIQETFSSKKDHPLAKFIFPEYEEGTKARLHNSEAGFYICQVSTLLFSPFSSCCQSCIYSDECKRITERKYHELFRIRTEAYNKK